jgi:ERCC4-related helicase
MKKAIVFFESAEQVKFWQAHLTRHCPWLKVETLIGRKHLTRKRRENNLSKFKAEEPGVKRLLLVNTAANEGTDIQGANLYIAWSPIVRSIALLQAEGRIGRGGTQAFNDAFIPQFITLCTLGTSEERRYMIGSSARNRLAKLLLAIRDRAQDTPKVKSPPSTRGGHARNRYKRPRRRGYTANGSTRELGIGPIPRSPLSSLRTGSRAWQRQKVLARNC